ncbi:MAG: L-fucose isomerase [Parcubacteria group bacterium LiPW_72]|nr:MAG: L-fucose isomerase [Parcubacteria group bacterium LiPW_72]
MLRELVGNPPIVGIYATIDPRTYLVPGLTEGSVKAQQLPVVMNRLEKVVALACQIKMYDGTPLRVVSAPIPVGGPRDAAIVQKFFEEQGVSIVINSMCTWSMGWETSFFGHPEWITAYEAMNGTAWPGAVLLNSKRASATAHMQPVFCIYPPDVEEMDPKAPLHPESIRRITQFLKCAGSVIMMRGKSYASIGHVSMGIAGSEPVSDILARWFGMKLVHVDQLEILMRMEHEMYDKDEVNRAYDWFFKTFEGRIDPYKKMTCHDHRELVEKLVKMTLVIRDIMRGNDVIKDEERSQGANALFGGTAGQRYWTDWYPNFDLPEAINSSTFDWNGLRPPIVHATENDFLNGMGMQWGAFLTGFSALFADLRTYWSPKKIKEATGFDMSPVAPTGFLHLINSGPAALDWATDPSLLPAEERMKQAIKGTEWHPANPGYFPGGGLSTHFVTPGGLPITMIRFNRIGQDVTLTVIEGHTVQLPDNAAEYVRQRTDPTWPDTFVVADGIDTFDVMSRGIDPNHVSAAIGHIGEEVMIMAAMLRIPVDYHNIAENRIFRPTLWTRLGGDREACKVLGPLYA